MHIALTRLGTGLGVLTLAATLAACSSSGKAKSSSTTASTGSTSSAAAASQPASASASTSAPGSSAASGGNLASVLISASDIPIPGFTEGTPQATPQGKGATVAFTAAATKRTIGDTVVVLNSTAQATAAATASLSAAKGQITGAQVSAAPIGDGGTAIRGTASGQEAAVLVWREGRSVIVLEFASAAGDPVPTSVIQTVATKQDAKVKTGIPG